MLNRANRMAVVVVIEWRSQSLLHKSQSNDSALHLSCRASSDGLKPHYFTLSAFHQSASSPQAALMCTVVGGRYEFYMPPCTLTLQFLVLAS